MREVASILSALLCAVPLAVAQEPSTVAQLEALVRGDGGEGGGAARCDALVELQARGALGVPVVLDALRSDDETLQLTAAAVLRHFWLEWPPELRAGIATDERVWPVVFDELSTAPRPAVDDWVADLARDARRPAALRLLALAARAAPMTRAEGEFVVRSLAGDDRGAARIAAALMPTDVADQLVGVVHALLLAGEPATTFQAWLDRLSGKGTLQLLGLATALEGPAGAALCDQIAQRDLPQYWNRVCAAVDGEIPLASMWLPRCGRLLDTEARQLRVAAVLADRSATEADRIHAFDALLEARAAPPGLLAFVRAGGADRWREMLRQCGAALPDPVVLEALDGDPQVALEAVRAFSRGPLRPAIEQRFLALVTEWSIHGDDKPGLARYDALLATLAQAAGDVGVRAALDAARALAADMPDELNSCYARLARRHDPVGASALLAELEQPDVRGEHGRALRESAMLALAEAGDRRLTEAIVLAAEKGSESFLRRCRAALPTLTPALWTRLLEAAPRVADVDARIELLTWLGRSDVPAVRSWLRDQWQRAATPEERDAALRAVLMGGERTQILDDWRRTAATGDEAQDDFAFAAIATMPDELGPADVDVLQYVLFTAPRHDPREKQRARDFPDGRTGFPLMGAVADRLRRDPKAAAAVFAPARELARVGDVDGLVRQRYLFLWTALQANPELRIEVAKATAAFVLAIPDPDDTGAGVANWYRALELSARGEHDGAAEAFDRAARLLLLRPVERMHARIHLGTRDPECGADAYAALAAAGDVARARAAAARGDREAVRDLLVRAREVAGRDRATIQAIDELNPAVRTPR